MPDRSTRITQHIPAPRSRVYAALISADAIEKWRVPQGMTAHVHSFEAREGGTYCISLTYESPYAQGKTSAHTDTYHGRFLKLAPHRQVVELDEFETDDPRLQREMKITITLEDSENGTDLVEVHENLPAGVSLEDNETGWRMSLEKLAAPVVAP